MKMENIGASQEAGLPPKTRFLEQLFEVSVFLFLIVPSMALSFLAIRQGRISFPITAYAIVSRDLALVCLIRYFLWRNGEHPVLIGWRSPSPQREIALGILLFIPFFFLMGGLEILLRAAGFTSPDTPLPSFLTARGMSEFLLAAVLVLVVAVAEETIFRGYLILRFKNLTTNTPIAVLLSAMIFAIGHGYEGTAGVVTVGVMGIAFALIYLWRGSLVAPITLHFLQDILGIVVLPLLGHK